MSVKNVKKSITFLYIFDWNMSLDINLSNSYDINDDYFSKFLINDCLVEALSLNQENYMNIKGIGKETSYTINKEYRSDKSCWITPNLCQEKNLIGMKTLIKQIMSQVKEWKNSNSLIQTLLGEKPNDYSFQLALYEGNGAHYVKHLDSHRVSKTERKLTIIVYLNDCNDGGNLRLYHYDDNNNNDTKSKLNHKDDNINQYTDVQPIAGRMVVFESEKIEHEVLPTFESRYALTVWVSKVCENEVANMLLEIKEKSINSIFVSIANYRDSECANTIISLFGSACNPQLLSIGVNLQGTAEELNELKNSLCKYSRTSLAMKEGRIRIIFIDHKLSNGPCWARHIVGSLWQGEKYLLQTDSHMRFVSDWDKYLCQKLEECRKINWITKYENLTNQKSKESESVKTNNYSKPILTAYPLPYKLPCNPQGDKPYFELPNSNHTTLLKPSCFENNGMLKQSANRVLVPSTEENQCLPSKLWAAGFSFSDAQVLRDVPYPPNLPGLFIGEEILMASRFYTNGYDFWTPARSVCFHLWERAHRPTFRENESKETNNSKQNANKIKSERMVRSMLRMQHHEDTTLNDTGYGLGSVRNLEDFQKRVGVSFQERIVNTNVSSTIPEEWIQTTAINEELETPAEEQIENIISRLFEGENAEQIKEYLG